MHWHLVSTFNKTPLYTKANKSPPRQYNQTPQFSELHKFKHLHFISNFTNLNIFTSYQTTQIFTQCSQAADFTIRRLQNYGLTCWHVDMLTCWHVDMFSRKQTTTSLFCDATLRGHLTAARWRQCGASQRRQLISQWRSVTCIKTESSLTPLWKHLAQVQATQPNCC